MNTLKKKVFNKLPFYIRYEIEYCHTEKGEMESALQDVLGKRGRRRKKCFPVQKLAIDLI